MPKEITYLKKALSSDEKILGVAEYHWSVYIKPVVGLLLALVVIAVVSIIFQVKMVPVGWTAIGVVVILFIYACLVRKKTEFIVTGRRVMQKFGIISVVTEELNNTRIESIIMNQSILGRILGYGTLYFSGTGTTKVIFPMIKEPLATKARFSEVIGKSS